MDIDLCNAALDLLGLDPIADPARPRGRVESAAVRGCLRLRAEVLEGNLWTACKKAATLEPEAAGEVPPGFSYVAVTPPDFLGLWKADAEAYTLMAIGEGESVRRRIAWRGGAAIRILYSGDIPFALMNPQLKQVCASRLAARLAIVQTERAADRKIHGDAAVADEMRAAARDALNQKEAPLFGSGFDTANAGVGDDPFFARRGSW
ncbi:MAG: hypothetical protein BroJett013_30530 [Alphaproteobacteria bacterium]|nr:MAG: hypothetical protein BroJett013_30530 [Alphaproteobacteria bacterium]